MLSYFRTRSQNEAKAHEELQRELMRLDLQSRVNQKRHEVHRKTMHKLVDSRANVNDPRMRMMINKEHTIQAKQQRLNQSYESLSAKLAFVEKSAMAHKELNMMPTITAATKVKDRSINKAKTLVDKMQANTENCDKLGGVLFTQLDTSQTSEEWSKEIEIAQANEIRDLLEQSELNQMNQLNQST